MPVLHLIAGPSGAGKSTLYRYLIRPRYPQLPFVDVDQEEGERLAHLRSGQSFVGETVLPQPSSLQHMADARARGFEVVLYVLCPEAPRRPVAAYERTIEKLREAIPQAHLAMLFDAADTDAGGPYLVASVVGGFIQPHGPWLPPWAREVLGLGAAA
jgi:ABC-type cobalamin/Fe3+-siderophores transport system ATPase subunit